MPLPRWRHCCFVLLLLGLANGLAVAQPQTRSRPEPAALEGVELFRLQSQLLSQFWGRPMFVEAGVVMPPEGPQATPMPPVCYSVHGFGGSHRVASRMGPRLREKMAAGEYPSMLYVFLNAQFPLGHHEFADSVNNGPWGQALVEEFIPALEAKFKAAGQPAGRFLTGHSSGGWSSLWLQVTYPQFFGGTWSTAPDPVDFRDFTGVDIYHFENAYVDPDGQEIQLVRRRGEWSTSLKQYAQREFAERDYGGQFASFDAVFSPRAEDGRPMKLFDRATGRLNADVAEHWKQYDIGLILKRQWPELGPQLAGKLHIYVGTLDTFRLEGAVKLLKADLQSLGSDAEILLVPGRDHGDLLAPHDDYWPEGLLPYIYRQMWAQWSRTQSAAGR